MSVEDAQWPSTVPLTVEINGTTVAAQVRPRTTLADFLRDGLGLTGTHLGCEQGVCGACTVLVDGRSVRACLMLAVQAQGRTVRTVEGLGTEQHLNDLQEAFRRHDAVQCGFCTPGILMTCMEILEQPDLDEPQARTALSGNICRCTGYQGIVSALVEVSTQRSRARGDRSANDG